MSAERVTVIILTRNESLHIERCIERLAGLADRVVVVDSFSDDNTVELATAAGAEVWSHAFVNHARQFQWAVDELDQTGGWIVRLDADEWFEPSAIAAVRRRMDGAEPDLSAFDFRRKVIFRGRWIRWGGYYRTVLTRVWRSGAAHIEQRWMDEHVVVDRGRVERISEGDLVDQNLKDIHDWTAKHNGYAIRQMIELLNLEIPLLGTPSPAAPLRGITRAKRWLRNRFYARFPLYIRSYLYFVWRYFIRLGFLDGRQGLVFHTLQGFWSFFLVDANTDEARTILAREGIEGLRRTLRTRHGITLEDAGS